MKEKYPELLLIDAGDAVKTENPYDLITYKYFIEGMFKIGYKILNFGQNELLIPVEKYKELVKLYPGIPFISANVTYKNGENIADPYKIVDVNGLKIGFIGITEDSTTNNTSENNGTNNETNSVGNYLVQDKFKSIEKYLPKLLLESDIQVLVASVSENEGRKLAKRFNQFEIIFFGGKTEKFKIWESDSLYGPFALGENQGAPFLLREGDFGRFQLICEIKLKQGEIVEFNAKDYELTEKYADDVPFGDLIVKAEKEMHEYSRKALTSDLPPPGDDEYVPPDDCALTDCHLDEYEVWENSDHEKAFVTLSNATRENISSPKTNPRCVGCHTLGFGDWDGGYVSTYQIPISHQSVSCGNCHGKAANHARATLEEIDKDKIRTEVSKPSYKTCIKCHDKENDTDFDYKRELETISKHGDKIHFEFDKVWDKFKKTNDYKLYLAAQKSN